MAKIFCNEEKQQQMHRQTFTACKAYTREVVSQLVINTFAMCCTEKVLESHLTIFILKIINF